MSGNFRGDVVDMVAELARQVRQSTLKRLAEADSRSLTWAPAGTSNHILWHAGHAVWLQDLLTIEPVTGRSELPPDWAARFGQNSSPAAVIDWPDAAEVRSHLETQLNRILELLAQNAATIVSNGNRISRETGWPLLPGMIHGWHDEARHQGEMYLLQKLWRAQR